MSTSEDSTLWRRRSASVLPIEDDFGGCLDARSAWKHFGGYSLPQAYSLFLKDPLNYQEDFMFMGSRAFEYYFPVVDRYLRVVSGDADSDGCQAAILGKGIALQFDWKDSALSGAVVSEIAELSAFVQADPGRFSSEPEEQIRIEEAWRDLDEKIATYRNRSEQAAPGNAGVASSFHSNARGPASLS